MFDGDEIAGPGPYERARQGIGYVPQGREIFPLLTVGKSQTGFGAAEGARTPNPGRHIHPVPILKTMLRRRGDACPVASSSNCRLASHW